MGILDSLAGTKKRDVLTAKALSEAREYAQKGLDEFTVTVRSTSGGAALLPRLVPFVISQLQAEGFQVVGSRIEEFSYAAFVTVRPGA